MKLNSSNPEIRWAKPVITDLIEVRKLRTSAEARKLKELIETASGFYSVRASFVLFLRSTINGAFGVSI